jgi:hypothetical protein
MNLENKKYLYSIGSSVSAAGGFEPLENRKDVRLAYEKKGIELPEKQVECSFPFFLAQNLGLECINESKSGLGIDGVIRIAYNWIVRNRNKINETLFIVEPPTGIRLDWYVREWKDFGILNAAKDENGNYPFTLVKEWFIDDEAEQNEWNEKYKNAIDGYFNNFYDEDIFRRIESSKILFFVSYLTQMNIDYFITLPHILENYTRSELNKIIPANRNLNTFLNSSTLWRYCGDQGWAISDEVDVNDEHIGYFGAKKIADVITPFILGESLCV